MQSFLLSSPFTALIQKPAKGNPARVSTWLLYLYSLCLISVTVSTWLNVSALCNCVCVWSCPFIFPLSQTRHSASTVPSSRFGFCFCVWGCQRRPSPVPYIVFFNRQRKPGCIYVKNKDCQFSPSFLREDLHWEANSAGSVRREARLLWQRTLSAYILERSWA